MTNEQLEVIFNKHSWAALNAISPSKYFCIPVMREAMRLDSIGFARWANDNQWENIGDGKWECDAWIVPRPDTHPEEGHSSGEIITDDQLYNKYLEYLKTKQ